MPLHHPIETLEDNGRRGYIYHDPHGYLDRGWAGQCLPFDPPSGPLRAPRANQPIERRWTNVHCTKNIEIPDGTRQLDVSAR